MRPCAAALQAFLDATGPINRAALQLDLYTVALPSGETLRWSGGHAALTVPAAGFPTGSINVGADRTFTLGPRFGRSMVTTKVGVEPTDLEIEIYAQPTDLIGTVPIATAVRYGMFDGATVELDRFFAPTPVGVAIDTSLGCLLWFYGRVAEVELGRSVIRLKVKSLLDLLAIQQMPRRLFMSSCGHVFGDTMCGYNRETGQAADGTPALAPVDVAAQVGTSQAWIYTGYTGGSPPPAAFVEGTIRGLSGLNTGYTRTISSLDGAGIAYLKKPFFFPVAIGDQFKLLVGCAHTMAACQERQNLARYGGFSYIPPPEQAV